MTPDSRLSWTLGIALALWIPAAYMMINGSLNVIHGCAIFLGALLFAWIGTGIVSHLVEGYRTSNQQVEIAKRQIEALEERAEQERADRRRRSDNQEQA